MRRGFTLIELLVVVAVVAVLIGVLLPAIGRARQSAIATACGSNLHELGLGLTMYLGDYGGELPQVRVDGSGNIVEGSDGNNIGALFGGKRGALPFFGIGTIGAARRPLNAYVGVEDVAPPGDEAQPDPDVEVPIFECPADAGTSDPFLDSLGLDTSNTYDLIGTSYNLNDHALDDVPGQEIYPTLIPQDGGKMPVSANPAKTWLVGDQPIYNYDDDGDRGQRWHFGAVRADLLFVDMHVEIGLEVKPGIENTTPDYTFLPRRRWLVQFGGDPSP